MLFFANIGFVFCFIQEKNNAFLRIFYIEYNKCVEMRIIFEGVKLFFDYFCIITITFKLQYYE